MCQNNLDQNQSRPLHRCCSVPNVVSQKRVCMRFRFLYDVIQQRCDIMWCNTSRTGGNMIQFESICFTSAPLWFILIQYDSIQHQKDSVRSNIIWFSIDINKLTNIIISFDAISFDSTPRWRQCESIPVSRYDPIGFNSLPIWFNLIW